MLYLNDSGVRSLRVRDSSGNAFVSDIGSPIDMLIQSSLVSGTTSSNAAACSVVEPGTGRGWEYLNGTIYVLSFYPSNQIVAWGTYSPSSQIGGQQIAFAPSLFVTFAGQVYALGTDSGGQAVFQYGGPNNNTYDNCIMTVQTPFHGMQSDTAVKSGWKLAADVYTDSGDVTFTLQVAASDIAFPDQAPEWGPPVLDSITGPTFDANKATFSARGSHFAVLATTNGTG